MIWTFGWWVFYVERGFRRNWFNPSLNSHKVLWGMRPSEEMNGGHWRKKTENKELSHLVLVGEVNVVWSWPVDKQWLLQTVHCQSLFPGLRCNLWETVNSYYSESKTQELRILMVQCLNWNSFWFWVMVI